MFAALIFLLLPFALVGFWERRPRIALIIAIILAYLILIIPSLIEVFQAMMIYGTEDPQLVAVLLTGALSNAMLIAIFIMFIASPALLIFQVFMRRRRNDKAKREAALKTFE